jgi:lipid II isoglutaminyl synthase (glutamine-hydrolysing)
VYRRAVGALARAAGGISRRAGVGGGTSISGLVLERGDPGFVRRRAGRLSDGVVLVSGTNGKTTTTAMIACILEAGGSPVVTNASGANLFRGVAASLLQAPAGATVGVFEVDEGALPRMVREVRPTVLVLTNVFRDQLDRFGEPESVAALLREAAAALPPDATVVVNADDPLLAHEIVGRRVVHFGVAPTPGEAPDGGDPEICPVCGAGLAYDGRTVAHLGEARCPACSWRSPIASVVATVTGPRRLDGMRLDIAGERVALPMGGLHNAYNAAAAVAAARAMGRPVGEAVAALTRVQARFGRAETLEVGGRPVWIALMKNPAGAGVVIEQVVEEPDVGAVLVAVSDRWADGRDVSWIWDADFEALAATGVAVVAGGRRAADVAVRLKYAGILPSATAADPAAALEAVVTTAPGGRSAAVLATYTAMLDLRRVALRSRSKSVADRAA